MPKKYRDLASRAAWTALQVVLGFLTIEALDIPVQWVGVVAPALSMLKSWVATKVGRNPNTVTFVEEAPELPLPASGSPGVNTEPGRSTFRHGDPERPSGRSSTSRPPGGSHRGW